MKGLRYLLKSPIFQLICKPHLCIRYLTTHGMWYLQYLEKWVHTIIILEICTKFNVENIMFKVNYLLKLMYRLPRLDAFKLRPFTKFFTFQCKVDCLVDNCTHTRCNHTSIYKTFHLVKERFTAVRFCWGMVHTDEKHVQFLKLLYDARRRRRRVLHSGCSILPCIQLWGVDTYMV